MRFMAVVALLTAFSLTAKAQQEIPTMEITLDKAIELALSENPTMKVAEKDIQNFTDKHIDEVDMLVAKKEKELMEI